MDRLEIPYTIILASSSPRRKDLLSQLRLPFKVDVRSIDESFPEELSPVQVAEYLARKKANAFDKLDDETLIITADTLVSIDGSILGKPQDEDDAYNMLETLSGKKHTVVSGVCLRTFDHEEVFSVCTDVYFRTLSMSEIDFYINEFKPMDKAGSYGIQEWIGFIGIERIDGCYYNVMGFPTSEVYTRLTQFAL